MIIKLIFDLFVIPGVDWNLTNNVFLIKNAIIVDFSSDHFVNLKKNERKQQVKAQEKYKE